MRDYYNGIFDLIWFDFACAFFLLSKSMMLVQVPFLQNTIFLCKCPRCLLWCYHQTTKINKSNQQNVLKLHLLRQNLWSSFQVLNGQPFWSIPAGGFSAIDWYWQGWHTIIFLGIDCWICWSVGHPWEKSIWKRSYFSHTVTATWIEHWHIIYSEKNLTVRTWKNEHLFKVYKLYSSHPFSGANYVSRFRCELPTPPATV